MKIFSRRQEAMLLFFVALVVGCGALFFYLTTPEAGQGIIYAAGGLILLLFLLHILLIWFNSDADQLLLPLAAMLTVLGLLGIYRVDPMLAARQWLWLMLGLAMLGMVVCFFKDYRVLEDYKYVFMVLAIIFLGITVLLGTTVGGARAWLDFGFLRFQPAEVVKLLVIFFLAGYLQETKEILTARKSYGFVALPEPRSMAPLVLMAVISLGLLVLQKDLGAALIFFGIFLIMLYTSTGRFSFLLSGLVFFALGAIAAYILFGHFRLRVSVWLNPWSKIDTAGYQITQSLFALASGGFFGTGFGLGQPQVIPAAATDLIFAVLTEELGMVGGIGIITIYMLLSYRGFRAALLAKDDFGMLLATGLTALLALQSFVILSGVMKLLPLTGVTLPFASYGGSSLLISFILLGLVMNVGASGHKGAER
ncbi:FtsW/RodA/SpoVE family cell cycle protein [Zhaonella formicivorans]|uniref:FtsW/RodA/SpoVE family cell cycle protein n=1 Tax=Zhaonella formicivorans TaxID=2528593 RepID=UPI0010EF3096|nr:FtsW/RodA/SpoVE family cell cycle protein [Zhaonella formicivorans]